MNKSKKKVIKYMVGSVTLFAAACAALPTIMNTTAGMLYKFTINNSKSTDNQGPVIEKKKKETK